MTKAELFTDEWDEGARKRPTSGLIVTADDDGGITIKTAAGVVLSIIDRSEGMRPDDPGFEPFVSVEVYPYDISKRTLGELSVPKEHLRNPKTSVTRYWVEAE